MSVKKAIYHRWRSHTSKVTRQWFYLSYICTYTTRHQVTSPLTENHFSSPVTVGTSIQRLFGQWLSCPFSRISRRHRQSSWPQEMTSWLQHISSICGQSGHTTRKSHVKLLSQGSSRLRSCTVSSRNVRTRIATSLASANDGPWIGCECVKMTLMNLFLHKRIS